MRFAYARSGGPLLNWSGVTPPYPSRAADTRSLGGWYPDVPRGGTSNALRRYGGRLAPPGGSAIPYEVNRQLGSLDLPRPGAPEVVEGYQSPQPGAAVIQLGAAGARHRGGTYPWNEAYPGQTSLSGYMPEGAIRNYGNTMLSADEQPKQFDWSIVRKVGIAASAYHGVKRNNGSILAGALWALASWAVFPFHGVIVPIIATAQGFGQPKLKTNPARRTRRYRRRRR